MMGIRTRRTVMAREDSCIGIVGGGLMGTGIATRFALAGHPVIVVEASPERAAGIPVVAADILAQLLEAGISDPAQRDAALARLQVSGELRALAGAAMAIEAIP